MPFFTYYANHYCHGRFSILLPTLVKFNEFLGDFGLLPLFFNAFSLFLSRIVPLFHSGREAEICYFFTIPVNPIEMVYF